MGRDREAGADGDAGGGGAARRHPVGIREQAGLPGSAELKTCEDLSTDRRVVLQISTAVRSIYSITLTLNTSSATIACSTTGVGRVGSARDQESPVVHTGDLRAEGVRAVRRLRLVGWFASPYLSSLQHCLLCMLLLFVIENRLLSVLFCSATLFPS